MRTVLHTKFFYLGMFLLGMFTIVFLGDACSSDLTQKKSTVSSSLNEILPDKVDFIFHVKPILSDRCFKCHGPDKSKVEAGLQLHTKELAFAGLGEEKDRYAIVAKDLDKSQMIHRIFTDNPDDMMPPPESNLSLSSHEKEILKRWIEQGAEWKEHWAFIPPVTQEIPEVSNTDWPSNSIDNFVLAKLEELNLNPSQRTQDEKLLRRLSFDLTGLPPTLEEIKSFTNDNSEDNYNKIIDKYLDSYAFAERMTNEWLDLARYADTHGYQDDLERTMWPWRDWVIHAFKNNMPYDKFVKWQLAGDLIPEASREQIIATAFNRNHKITQEGGVIPEEYRAEYVTDRTNTFGTAFLGLTFECAKCHDHKYDPIGQEEYFQLYSYFNNIDEEGLIASYGAIPEPYIKITKEEIESTLHFINNLDTIDSIPLLVMKELDKPRETHVLNRGVYDQPLKRVESNVPKFGKKDTNNSYKDRLGLSDWLFTDTNPLTSRVMVNRIWQQIFGKGIVSTSYDFGNQGALPTHPGLLDHLAMKFKNDAWDIRKIIKYIVNSSTYKQESKISERMLELDPENDFLARAPRSRLSAEMLRDHALSISGLLVHDVGGPSVKPYQPDGLWNEVTGGGGGSTAKYVQDEGDNNYRRSLYTFWKRTVPPPNMMLFDTPTRDFCSVQRENTSTPLQALVLMNDPTYLEASKALAYRAILENKDETDKYNPSDIIQYMFTLATSRKASDNEVRSLVSMYKEEYDRFKEKPNAATSLLSYGNFATPAFHDNESLAAFSFIANTIFNLDETIRKS